MVRDPSCQLALNIDFEDVTSLIGVPVSACSGLPLQCFTFSSTVIQFLFVAKIFSDTENVRKYFTQI